MFHGFVMPRACSKNLYADFVYSPLTFSPCSWILSIVSSFQNFCSAWFMSLMFSVSRFFVRFFIHGGISIGYERMLLVVFLGNFNDLFIPNL